MVLAEISIKLIFLPNRKESSVPLLGKNFRTAPYFIMHARLINYAFYSLSLNTIQDNSLGNWINTSLIITYCTNKRGFFFHGVSFRAVFLFLSFSLSLFLSLFPISLAGTSYYLSFLQGPSQSLISFFTLPAGFELSILYRLRQTSLSSIPLFYMCFLPIKGNFQNYISNTLFKFQKLTLKSFSSPLKHVGFCTKKWDVSPRSLRRRKVGLWWHLLWNQGLLPCTGRAHG